MACWSLCLLCIGMSLFSLTQESVSAPISGSRSHMLYNSPTSEARGSHNTHGGRSKSRRYYLKFSHHLNKVQPVMSSNIKPHRNPGLRIVVGEPVNDISEAKLYHLLPYEAVENTNTPERQAYKFKVFYGSKFVPHKKKTALHRRTRNKTKLPSLKRMHSYQ
ncbi:uncharacterized protein LOC106872832 [Octopus bimaculoides]|uniref:uncharacterized protein LOC106872832 n=1 Tax=Octopus bimaculoides TaxID=37653 RepID=UPI00071CE832|nr:uncharacterized protein LOC106872832 [Octopus bimaculoides]|eukprot:XP_014775444.1 PREDICTED: uncharacterized protein LOC106872832 [Octopus bimaculoides]